MVLLFLAVLAAAQPAEPPNGVLLVAKPSLTDPNFRQTVVLVTQTPDAQTVGVILNRPTERKLSDETVYFGGPVLRETLVALFQSREQPETPAFHVLQGVYLTMQPETIERLSARRALRFRLYAGFSGWAPRQLQGELARDDWYVLPASVDLLFRKDTAGLWGELLAKARGERAAVERKSPAGAELGRPVAGPVPQERHH
jgi:putative transcriptional regulator